MHEGPLAEASCQWFSLEIHRSHLPAQIVLGADMGSDIAFFEGLAQVTLLTLIGSASTEMRGGRIVMQCDNEGVVGAAAKGLTTAEPLCVAMQCLATWERRLELKAVIRHIPGDANTLADALSRWRSKRHLLRQLQWKNMHNVDLDHVLEPVMQGCP